MKTKKERFLKWSPVIVMTAVGGLAGYLYYFFIGCLTGSCPITSNPIVSTFYCALIGALIGTLFVPTQKKKTSSCVDNKPSSE